MSTESKSIITHVAKGVAYRGDHMHKNSSWPLQHSQEDVSKEPDTVVVIASKGLETMKISKRQPQWTSTVTLGFVLYVYS